MLGSASLGSAPLGASGNFDPATLSAFAVSTSTVTAALSTGITLAAAAASSSSASLFSPPHSPRRTSLFLPIRVSISRATPTRDRSTVTSEWTVILDQEPADIQARRGSLLNAEAGIVTHRTFRGYFDPLSGVTTGDRIISNGETFRVEYVAQKGRHLEADLERVV